VKTDRLVLRRRGTSEWAIEDTPNKRRRRPNGGDIEKALLEFCQSKPWLGFGLALDSPESETERERERDRESERETERDRERETGRVRETERVRERERQREWERQGEWERQREENEKIRGAYLCC
jgi:hypothetical protein